MDKKIAFLFCPNRFSQKIARHIEFKINQDKKEINFKVEPFNFKKHTNPKKRNERLAEYDYIICFEFDEDIIEYLKFYNLKYNILNPELKTNSLTYYNINKKIYFRTDENYIIESIKKVLKIKNIKQCYCFYEYKNLMIKKIYSEEKNIYPNQKYTDKFYTLEELKKYYIDIYKDEIEKYKDRIKTYKYKIEKLNNIKEEDIKEE